MQSTRILIGAAMLVAVACGATSPNATGPTGRGNLPPVKDAPYQLAADRDLEDMRDRYETMDPGQPERARLRRELADEYARRMTRAMSRAGAGDQAHDMLLALLGLWRTDELARASDQELTRQLGPYAGMVRDLRDRFARSGRDVETTAALLFLALADPDHKDEYQAEIDEIFAFADDLSRAQYGEGAEGSRPIEILEAIVAVAPVPAAVDQLIDRYLSRQKAFHARFRQHGPSAQLIRAHGESVFKTAWNIVRVLARAGRLDQARQTINTIEGLGANRSLREAVNDALADSATPRDWLEMAALFAETKPNDEPAEVASKMRTVLAICRAGSRRFANSAALPMRAAEAARQLDMLHMSIRLYEEAWAREPTNRDAAEALAELYRVRVSTLAFYDRPLAAQKRLAELEAFHAQVARRWPKKPLESDLAEAHAAMGRGMVSLGELTRARDYLQKSLSLRPTLGALEQLGTMELKQDRFAQAMGHFERALDLPAKEPLEQYNRAKILRLAGDALHGAGLQERARRRWTEAIEAWMDIGSQLDLPPAYKGELLVESGKAQWALGDRDTAMLAFDKAVDVDPSGADTHSSVVAFLLVRGEYERALDTYHRALGSYEISDYSKVYLSLWVLAEARRSDRRPDPLAMEYLAGRTGTLWHDALARYASGQSDLAMLERRAHTRGQRAELLYYSAVLGNADKPRDIRTLLERVVATDMVLFYEYEMAKHWLTEGFAPRVQASR